QTEDLYASREHPPASLHPHVATQDHSAFEAEQEVLADCVDGLEPPPVQQRRELFHGRTRVWRLDFELVADEHLQASGHAMDCVSFRHRAKCTAPKAGQTRRV